MSHVRREPDPTFATTASTSPSCTQSFPALSLGWSVKQGIDELVGAYAEHGMSADDFTSSSYTRLRRIEELLSAGVIDNDLRRVPSGADRHTPVGAA